MGQVERALGDEENSIGDIRRYFETPFFELDSPPMQPNEFVAFWKSLSEEDKAEFKKAELK